MPRPSQSHNRLAGKAALVTGAGGSSDGDGIGMAIARAGDGRGERHAGRHRPARGEYTRALIEGAGGRALAVEADIRDDEDCGRAVDAGLHGSAGSTSW